MRGVTARHIKTLEKRRNYLVDKENEDDSERPWQVTNAITAERVALDAAIAELKDVLAVRKDSQPVDSRAMDRICVLLDAIEWSPTTLELIRDVVVSTGREVREPIVFDD